MQRVHVKIDNKLKVQVQLAGLAPFLILSHADDLEFNISFEQRKYDNNNCFWERKRNDIALCFNIQDCSSFVYLLARNLATGVPFLY